MTTLHKCKQASPTDRSSDNSDQENIPPSSQCHGHKTAQHQLSTSNIQTAVLENDEDSCHHAAFEENILVGSAAKADADSCEFMSFVKELVH